MWFAAFPTVKTLVVQFLAALSVFPIGYGIQVGADLLTEDSRSFSPSPSPSTVKLFPSRRVVG
jgi:hypothetical protein